MNTLTHVGNLFAFIGGLGMFLYGMDIMASGLQKTAGNKMKDLLGYLTNNRILGVLVGALVTAIIQSSSATTVMVVGFVNAGIMNLTQAAGVIMGANVGTTITAWLVSANEWAGALKPDFFAPFILGIGAFIITFSNKQKMTQKAEIAVGFGILFIGLSSMSSSISVYQDSPIFYKAFQREMPKNRIRNGTKKMSQKLKTSIIGIVTVIVLLIFDQLTKYMAVLQLKDAAPFVLFKDVFELKYLENHGAAFGVLQNQRFLLLLITIVILGVLCFLYSRIPAKKRYFPLRATGILLAAGAVGNMIDRFINGYVVDFFYFKWIDFPIFNVADCYVVVAAVLAFFLVCFYYKDEDFDFLKKDKKS